MTKFSEFPYVADRFNAVRRETVQVRVGEALIGGNAPILVQSMTTTKPKDVKIRPRTIDVMGSQPSLHMANWNLLIKCSQCSSRGSCCVTMNENHIGLHIFQDITHACKHTGCNII